MIAGAVVGVLVYRSSSGQGSGASAPDGAVRALATALEHGDYLAVVDLLPPDEQGGLADAWKMIASDGHKAGIASPTRSLSLGRVSVKELAPGVAAVDPVGSLEVDFGRSSLIGRMRSPKPSSFRLESADFGSQKLDYSPRLILIRENGRWYVDPLLTVGDLIVQKYHLPPGNFAAALVQAAPRSAPSATAAATELIRAAEDKDTAAAAAVVGPAEGRLLRVFAPAIDDLIHRGDGRLNLDQVTVDSEGVDRVLVGNLGTVRGPGDPCAEEHLTPYCVLADPEFRSHLGLRGLTLYASQTGNGGYRVDVLRSLAELVDVVAAKLGREDVLAAAAHIDPKVAVLTGGAQSLTLGASAALGIGEPYSVFQTTTSDRRSLFFTAPNALGVASFARDSTGVWRKTQSAYDFFGNIWKYQQTIDYLPAGATLRFVVFPGLASECSDRAKFINPALWAISGCWYGAQSDPGGPLTVQPIPEYTANVPGEVHGNGSDQVGQVRIHFRLDQAESVLVQGSSETQLLNDGERQLRATNTTYNPSYLCSGVCQPVSLPPGNYLIVLTRPSPSWSVTLSTG